MKNQTAWTVPLPPEDWTTINPDTLQEIQRLGEQRAQETIDTISKQRQQAFTIISIFIPIATLLFAVSTAKGHSFQLPAALLIIPCVWCIWRLSSIIMPRNTAVAGIMPKDTALPDFLFHEGLNKEQQALALRISMIERLQEKIDYNDVIIGEHIQRVQAVLKVTIISLALAAALVLVSGVAAY